MTFIDRKIEITISQLKNSRDVEVYPCELYYIPCEYKKSNTPPADSETWEKFPGQVPDPSNDKHYWFKADIVVPDSKEGVEYRLRATTDKSGWDASTPQCTLFIDNDTAYQAFDINHLETPVSSGKHRVYIYFYNGMNNAKKNRIQSCDIRHRSYNKRSLLRHERSVSSQQSLHGTKQTNSPTTHLFGKVSTAVKFLRYFRRVMSTNSNPLP